MNRLSARSFLLALIAVASLASIVLFVPWTFLGSKMAPLPASISGQVDNSPALGLDGMIVYIDEQGQPPVTLTAGWHNKELRQPASGDAYFKIASISKLYLAVVAVKLAAQVGTLLIWVGEAGVRLYAAGQPGGARSDKLLYQAKLALDENLRLKVVRKMFELRFGEPAPERRSVDQLRGIEGARVRKTYELLAKQYGVEWRGRRYDPKDWEKGDVVNQCISAATSCLYGVTEAAILAAGYAPAIGFIHSGKQLSFVYDMADIVKFDAVVP